MEVIIMALKKAESNEMAKVVEQIENENIRQLNDLPVDEDGVVRDVPLLAGIEYEGELLKTFSFREMNGKDEEAINKPEVRANGGRLVNVLLERTVIDIGGKTRKELGPKKWGELIRTMLGADLDYMAMKVRQLSKGNDITFTHKCPNCKATLKTIVGIDEFEIIPFNGLYTYGFELPGRGYKDSKGVIHKVGTLRQANGEDREIVFPLFKKNSASATTMLLTRLMSFDDGTPVFNDRVADMSLRDREYLQDLIKENIFGIDTNLELTCDVCGEDISGQIGSSDFF